MVRPAFGEGGRDDDARTPGSPESGRKLGGDVTTEGGIQLLVNDARTTNGPRNVHDTLRGEARGHVTRIGIERNGVYIGGRRRLTAKNHGSPVTGTHELYASIRGTGQIICDDSYQHATAFGLRLSARSG